MGALPLQTAPQSESRGIQRGGCRCQRSLHQQDMFLLWEDTQHRKQEAYALLLWGGCGSRSSRCSRYPTASFVGYDQSYTGLHGQQGVESLTDSTLVSKIVTDPSLGFTHSFSLYSILKCFGTVHDSNLSQTRSTNLNPIFVCFVSISILLCTVQAKASMLQNLP